ncbi:fimbrial protein [Serratia rubidaea]|uniref:Fimbrial protein n=1 Tax=Serratia rubidaea TaxID=61652 RepID=A0ABS0MBC3_SERRU|nr:fimbrial protein [Serratia rubidaea]MBH1929654.1 fimbrial protein [Serratia rubidaea]MDC6118407.1 fimbrial protein [Serratia rubidaea]
MRWRALLALLLFGGTAHAEPDNTCWGEPVNTSVVDLGNVKFHGNKKGTISDVINYSVRGKLSGICNRSAKDATMMAYYRDLGPALTPSPDSNSTKYYTLSDDVDIMIMSGGIYSYLPLGPYNWPFGDFVPPLGQGIRFDNIENIASTGQIYLKLRRDVIGGAIVIPSDIVLFSVYPVVRMHINPPRASTPVFEAHTKTGGQVIPVGQECSINQGNTINVNFNILQTDQVPTSGNGKRYSKDITLNFSCNSRITQDVRVQLVADTAEFSSDLIRSDNNQLGFALKHNGQLVKPMNSFGARLYSGAGSDEITLMPVKDLKVPLQAGAFNASATLVIMTL